MKSNKKQLIMDIAMQAAREVCLNCVTTKNIAERVGCARNNITHFFGTTADLHDAIVAEAIRKRDYVVLSQAIVLQNRIVHHAPLELRKQSMQYLKDELK